ncbi:MAG: hypothetical protein HYX53_12910 [Chloroflexi bacterium]|nr:hypothetical protein [Chloroflexota bacterium]
MLRRGFEAKGRVAAIVVAGVVLGVPLGLLWWLRTGAEDTLAGVTFDAAPVFAAPTPREITDEKPVKLTPAWAKGQPLSAPAWAGVVTAVAAQPDGSLTSGDTVASVAGVSRLAFASAQPFYRPIAVGAEGADVAELHRLLLMKGFLKSAPTDPSVATQATATATRALAAALGVAPVTSVFDPGWVVWLPVDPFPVGSVDLQVGRPAPPAGASIATAQSSLTTATIAPLNQEALALDGAAEWQVEIGGGTFAMAPGGSLSVSPNALPALAKALKPDAESATGTVRRKSPLLVLGVASTAIQSNRRGDLCAWVADGRAYRAVAVKVASARAGVTNVTDGLAPGAQVLVNPAAVLERPECP